MRVRDLQGYPMYQMRAYLNNNFNLAARAKICGLREPLLV